jgi:hypothetical protein
MGWMEYITFGFAVVGAGLGVLNYWHDRRRNSVQLKVRPKFALVKWNGPEHVDFHAVGNAQIPDDRFILMVTIANRSFFAVEIEMIELLKLSSSEFLTSLRFDALPAKSWPHKLEQGESMHIFFNEISPSECIKKGINGVRVAVSTGEKRVGRHPVFKKTMQKHRSLTTSQSAPSD